MSVRYVLPSVLPRYTMSGPNPSVPPARALRDVSEPTQNVSPKQIGELAAAGGTDVRMVPNTDFAWFGERDGRGRMIWWRRGHD